VFPKVTVGEPLGVQLSPEIPANALMSAATNSASLLVEWARPSTYCAKRSQSVGDPSSFVLDVHNPKGSVYVAPLYRDRLALGRELPSSEQPSSSSLSVVSNSVPAVTLRVQP